MAPKEHRSEEQSKQFGSKASFADVMTTIHWTRECSAPIARYC